MSVRMKAWTWRVRWTAWRSKRAIRRLGKKARRATEAWRRYAVALLTLPHTGD